MAQSKIHKEHKWCQQYSCIIDICGRTKLKKNFQEKKTFLNRDFREFVSFFQNVTTFAHQFLKPKLVGEAVTRCICTENRWLWIMTPNKPTRVKSTLFSCKDSQAPISSDCNVYALAILDSVCRSTYVWPGISTIFHKNKEHFVLKCSLKNKRTNSVF